MTMERKAILLIIQSLLQTYTDGPVTEDMDLRHDLGLDSLDVTMLSIDVGTKFCVYTDTQITTLQNPVNWKTVKDIVDEVDAAVNDDKNTSHN